MVENESGNIMLLKADSLATREVIAKRLLTPEQSDDTFKGVKRVRISRNIFRLNWVLILAVVLGV